MPGTTVLTVGKLEAALLQFGEPRGEQGSDSNRQGALKRKAAV